MQISVPTGAGHRDTRRPCTVSTWPAIFPAGCGTGSHPTGRPMRNRGGRGHSSHVSASNDLRQSNMGRLVHKPTCPTENRKWYQGRITAWSCRTSVRRLHLRASMSGGTFFGCASRAIEARLPDVCRNGRPGRRRWSPTGRRRYCEIETGKTAVISSILHPRASPPSDPRSRRTDKAEERTHRPVKNRSEARTLNSIRFNPQKSVQRSKPTESTGLRHDSAAMPIRITPIHSCPL